MCIINYFKPYLNKVFYFYREIYSNINREMQNMTNPEYTYIFSVS